MKRIAFIIFCCAIYLNTSAQQDLYKWRIGIHGGPSTYYGDLSSSRFLDPQTTHFKFWDKTETLSYGLSLEYSMNKAWGFRFMSTRGAFEGNSRATKWNGDAFTEDTEKYIKALNFRTTFQDVDALFIYHFDNGKFFGEKSLFAPYIGVGLGYLNFKAKGDLYQDNGSRYYYWSDNTIRDIDENDPLAASANIIEQDGKYETELRDLQTEGVDYSNNSLTVPVVLGFKFRVGNRFNVNLETLLHYTFSDYIDDVSGNYIYDYDSPAQAYAGNPSGIIRNERGNNNLKDIYGVFNIGIGYNFGYKKKAFNAPVFYIGDAEPAMKVTPPVTPSLPSVPVPVLPEETNEPVTIITPTIVEPEVPRIDPFQDYSDLYFEEQDTFELYSEPVYITIRDTVIINQTDTLKNQTFVIDNVTVNQINVDTIIQGENKIIRDTIYERGTLIKENVIIRTDTIREIIENKTIIEYEVDTVFLKDDRSGLIIPLENEPIEAFVLNEEELDTVVIFDPETKKEEIFFVSEDDIVIEPVPEEPVFTLETIENVNASEIDADFFNETVGILEDDLSKEEVILSDIQTSNFELIALRNEINEMKAKEDKSEADIDAIYEKLDELSNEYRSYEQYNNGLAIQGNAEHAKPENQDIQYATQSMGQVLSDIRTEIIYLEKSNTETISKMEYDLIRKENEKRIEDLEKDMRKLRKKVRKANRPDVVNNPSRVNYVKKPKKPKTKKETIVIDNSNPELEQYYKSQIDKLERELKRLEVVSAAASNRKDGEIQSLNNKLEALERKMNTVQTTGNSDAKTLEFISNLERKMDQLNIQLNDTQKELTTLKNRPAPQPVTTTIIKTTPAPKPAPAPVVISTPAPIRSQVIYTKPSSSEAIALLGATNVYFDTGKSNIKAEFYNQLDRAINIMTEYPEIKARVTGYTDKSGNAQANLRLSQKRSAAVSAYMIQRGIASSRILVDSQGVAPASTNNDPFARRVEIIMNNY